MVLIPGRIFYAGGQKRLVAPMLHTMLCPKARFNGFKGEKKSPAFRRSTVPLRDSQD